MIMATPTQYLNPGKQLFIDDYFIESLDGARRVLNHPRKVTDREPLEVPMDRPWEQGRPPAPRMCTRSRPRCPVWATESGPPGPRGPCLAVITHHNRNRKGIDPDVRRHKARDGRLGYGPRAR